MQALPEIGHFVLFFTFLVLTIPNLTTATGCTALGAICLNNGSNVQTTSLHSIKRNEIVKEKESLPEQHSDAESSENSLVRCYATGLNEMRSSLQSAVIRYCI